MAASTTAAIMAPALAALAAMRNPAAHPLATPAVKTLATIIKPISTASGTTSSQINLDALSSVADSPQLEYP